jgi:HSP20 family molecular chaperone IbpA
MPGWDFNSWLWERADALVDEFERLQRQRLQSGRSRRPITWQPAIDIFETDEALCLIAALPGVDPAGVEILLEKTRLGIRGVRTLPGICRRAVVHRMELPCGGFERWIELPAGRFELAEKQMLNGCLVLCLKKLIHVPREPN